MGHPTIYPTGVTVYNPEKCWNGFTIFQALEVGAVLMNMNGRENKVWKGVHGFPNKIFPGGYLMTSRGSRDGRYGVQDGLDLGQIDWDGNVVWKFDRNEYIEDPGIPGRWMARSHHDYQREGSTTGYYAPGMEPKTDSGNTLVLAHRNARNPKISDKQLLDDVILEVDWDGDIVWEWNCNEHFDEMGFREGPKNTLARNPNYRPTQPEGMGDWMHINSMSVLGPNKWYDAGDERFHPDNIIVDGREANIIFIISKATGKITWKLGPDYDNSPEAKAIGWIIGQHHAHMIPHTLPGGGNILVFDNGGWGGYGVPNPGSRDGSKNALRDYSRIIEFDPTTLEIVWKLTPKELGHAIPTDASKFYSPYVSSAQRLPNGNTLVDEGSDGRLIEVTPDHEIVWEWICPYYSHNEEGPRNNMVYRAYRYPYSYVPQEPVPQEVPVERIDNATWRLPNAGAFGAKTVVDVEGTLPYYPDVALCVATDDTADLSLREKVFSVDTDVFVPVDTRGAWNDEVLKAEGKPVLVLFGAERCVHCKALHPVLEEALGEEYEGMFRIRYVDVDKSPEIAKGCQALGIPVVAVFNQGKGVWRFAGERDYDDVCELLDRALA